MPETAFSFPERFNFQGTETKRKDPEMMKITLNPRVLAAYERAAQIAAADGQKDVRQTMQDDKAVKAAFDAYLKKAPFEARMAFVESLVAYAPESAAPRFARVLERMARAEEAAKAAAEAAAKRAEEQAVAAEAAAEVAEGPVKAAKPKDGGVAQA